MPASFKNSGTKPSKERFGSGINTTINTQLKAREALYSREVKSKKDLLLINSNNAWIKLRSGVDADPGYIEINTDYGSAAAYFAALDAGEVDAFTSTLARNNALGGFERAVGIYTGWGDSTQTSKFIDSGIQRGGNSNPAYSNTTSRGFVPKPRINSFNIDTKNTYGSLRTATIGIVIYSLEDLEILDKLYFRPGMSALVEWGHSVYTDNGTNIYSSPTVFDSGKWFEPAASQGIYAIEQEIARLRGASSYNYDGFFGYIYNFSWNFRQDGGYDCTINIVSKGLILDSMQAGKTSNLPNDALEETKETDLNKYVSPFHYFFGEIREEKKFLEFTSDGIPAVEEGKGAAFKKLDKFTIFRHYWESGKFDFKRDFLYYIKLRTFLDMLNKYSSFYNIERNENLIEFDIRYGEKYNTFPGHFSIDPMNAITPAKPKGTRPEYRDLNVIGEKGSDMHSQIENHANKEGGTNDIMNIMVSCRLLEDEIQSALAGPKDVDQGIFDALKNILSKIQNAFGDINNFEIVYEEETTKHKIVDRDIIAEVESNVPTINVTGLKATIQDLSISSKISNQMASQIAIAAQGTPANYKSNVSAILKWNSDVRDRHKPKVSTNPEGKPEDVKKSPSAEDYLFRAIHLAYLNFNKLQRRLKPVENSNSKNVQLEDRTSGVYDPELFTSIATEAKELLRKNFSSIKEEKSFSVGVIPVELEFKMLGISGLKVGTTFKINKGILPSRYDKWGYIITGLTNSIENNKWYTTVKTQFYKV